MSDVFTEIHHGDCVEVMGDMEEESVHAIVTDPPYGLAFMSRSWDDFDPQEYEDFCRDWAEAAYDALKPGGHLLAFSGNRTHHRMMTGVEKAGYEIRDTITWHYASGMPKGRNVSKAIDDEMDVEREVSRTKTFTQGGGNALNMREGEEHEVEHEYTEPGSDEAKKWDGWNTTLSPATEFVVVARKSLAADTVEENVLTHGTGALNIDGTRPDGGRWTANVVYDEAEAAQLDEEVGELSSGAYPSERNTAGYEGGFKQGETGHSRVETDAGGPSRYFYTSKAKQSERSVDGSVDNPHPTVKPIDLMEWLVKLVTHEKQIVLDPFLGSGTTLMATWNMGRSGIGIERNDEHVETARERVEANKSDRSAVGTKPTHDHESALEW